jgi:ubiquitin carboxyl-terminal hydrolase 7
MKLITNVESKTRSEKSIVRQVHVYDIHLKVHRRKDVFEALDHYVSTKDVWDQKICYDYCIFLSFPKVLHFHILRSYLDSETNTKKICNTSFEFNEKMNLKNYLEQTRNSKNKCAPCTDFILHSVFARSADENHYVLFVNPRCDGNWYKFENDTVTRVHEDEAIKENYVRDGRTSNKGQTSAYMLTYIQVSAIDEILVEIDENDIPQNLREKFYENYMKSKFVDANL